jgi:hypothetical protein
MTLGAERIREGGLEEAEPMLAARERARVEARARRVAADKAEADSAESAGADSAAPAAAARPGAAA